MEQKWTYAIIGLLSGILIAVLVASNAVNSNNQGMMRVMGMSVENMLGEKDEMMHGSSVQSTMNDMTANLKGKTGDEFDKAFISEMIIHHQGAIDMANLAKENAGHEEIKGLAEDIIAAQTKEIEMMRQWQKDWGF